MAHDGVIDFTVLSRRILQSQLFYQKIVPLQRKFFMFFEAFQSLLHRHIHLLVQLIQFEKYPCVTLIQSKRSLHFPYSILRPVHFIEINQSQIAVHSREAAVCRIGIFPQFHRSVILQFVIEQAAQIVGSLRSFIPMLFQGADCILKHQDVFELVREAVERIITLCFPVRCKSFIRSAKRISAVIVCQRVHAFGQAEDPCRIFRQSCLEEVSCGCQVIA